MSIKKSQLEQNLIGWKKSFAENFSQDDNGNPLPWMTYPFIDYISQKLNKNQQIFEFGLGASTFFFAKKVKKVISLESNPLWLKIMKEKLKEEKINNVEIILMPDAITNENYEKYTQKYPEKFDFIIVDSLKRFNCCQASINSLKENGSLILDDSQRKSYQKIFTFFTQNNFKTQNFSGIAPGQLSLKNTTIFKK